MRPPVNYHHKRKNSGGLKQNKETKQATGSAAWAFCNKCEFVENHNTKLLLVVDLRKSHLECCSKSHMLKVFTDRNPMSK